MTGRDHPLFQTHPLNGTTTLSTGDTPMPYHIYDGYGAFVGGTANLASVRALVQSEHVIPMRTEDGRALMGIWICNFLDASLGAHHELQFSIFVSRGEAPPIPSGRMRLLAAMLTRPDLQMLCHGLWNNTPVVVAYNRELLSLNARLTTSTIEREGDALTFAFREAASGALILEGRLRGRDTLGAGIAFTSALGLGRAASVARQPWIKMDVVNPVGVVLDKNAVAETFTKNDRNSIRYFGDDTLTFGSHAYGQLQFKPDFIQLMDGFKFVYLNPR